MGRMLATCVLAASILAAGPAFDKKPRIWAQPLAEKTMVEKSYSIKVAPKIEEFLAKWSLNRNVTLSNESVGSRRMMVELEYAPKEATAYAQKYDQFVA